MRAGQRHWQGRVLRGAVALTGGTLLCAMSALAGGPKLMPLRWALVGDTQSLTLSSELGDAWVAENRWLCTNRAQRRVFAVIGTGDIVYSYQNESQRVQADRAMDVLDACGLPNWVPSGNHDTAYTLPPPYPWGPHLAWMTATRAAHRPLAESPSKLTFVWRMMPGVVFLALPWRPDAAEIAWARAYLARVRESVWLFEHDAVDPAVRPSLRSSAALTLAQELGPRAIGVIGGHYTPQDRVAMWATPSGLLAVFSNFQDHDPANSAIWLTGWLTWLEFTPAGEWCVVDENVTTGVTGRFEVRRCFPG